MALLILLVTKEYKQFRCTNRNLILKGFHMLNNIGTTEVLIVCGVLLVLFGGKRIPMFVRSMGDSVNEFRNSVKSE